MPDRLSIEVDGRHTTGLAYSADAGNRMGATLILAHGAGAGQTSTFIVNFAEGLAARGVDILTFNFLYTEQARKLPDRTQLLDACYRAVVETAQHHPPFAGNKLFIGGKSMGGRIASHVAAAGDSTAASLSGVVLLGYPLHPPGKPDQLRVEHLKNIRVPVLVVQGERDPFGSPDELAPHFRTIKRPVTVHAIERGDHSLAPPRSHGSPDDTHNAIQDRIAEWVRSTTAG